MTPYSVSQLLVNPPVIEMDDKHEAFFSPRVGSVYDAFSPPTAEVEKKVRAIEEKLKTMEGSNALGLDVAEMCLVPGVRIPAKFKVPDFEKYKGERDPRTHIWSYYRKMVVYYDYERLLMHFFQDSLSGDSLEWYIQLKVTHILTWRDMAETFLKHYQYNTDMAPNHTRLKNLTLEFDETFNEYAQCWRKLVARVKPPLLERELEDIFIINLQGHLVIVSERIENMIKMRKIQNASHTSGVVKKPYVGFGKKREGETNETAVVRGRVPTYHASYQQVVVVSPVQNQQPYVIPTDQQPVPYQQQYASQQ
ncbi:uncharacterized protein LOC127079285 [Lathyrus oleraceus]|uniref:uncharacterized protein LOC127079285 n=1 Tax=Pisum sativum TaxID=3888 RepID=UPI0021CF7E3C|nr:uncharacterized protein LOC127079285 [Pisum sativum]